MVKKTSKTLRRNGGPSTEHQHDNDELKGLKNALRHLERLEPDHENKKYINAVEDMALACQLPLREFLIKLEKYEAS